MPVVHQLTAAKRGAVNLPNLDKMADLPEMNGQLAKLWVKWRTCRRLMANFEKKWHPGQISNNSAQAGSKQRSWHQPNQYNGTQAK
jgi:hypothetical protein